MNNKNIIRKTIQYSLFLYLVFLFVKSVISGNNSTDFEAYCPFGGIQSLSSFLLNNTLACSMTSTQIVMGIILVIAVILFGKLFCSFICPVGTISELLAKSGLNIKIKYKIPEFADKYLRILKYALLFITFYYTLESSELFCKKYDPYYALMSGFGYDVVIMFASISIAFIIISIVARMFWCKYLCPLSALSNIFRYYWITIPLLIIYFTLNYSGFYISHIWLLLSVCTIIAGLEVIYTKNTKYSLLKITRNTTSCTNCNLCNKTCHQNINITSHKSITHIDCNLCSDCLHVCPEENTLNINNRKLKYLPALALISLIVIGFTLANKWEIPTINEQWGTRNQIKNSQTLVIKDLNNITCFGSSKAFASKMKKINGVYGVSTFIKDKKVKIIYNPDITNSDHISEMIFKPATISLTPLNKEQKYIYEYTMGVEGLFDSKDNYHLQTLLKSNLNINGFLSEYGCPVTLKIYSQTELEIENLKKSIEAKEVNYIINGKTYSKKINFKVVTYTDVPSKIKTIEYLHSINNMRIEKFNNYDKLPKDILSTYKVKMPYSTNNDNKQESLLISHISRNKNLVKFKTSIDSLGNKYAIITYIDTAINDSEIFNILNSEKLSITYTNGTVKQINNPFIFVTKGVSHKYANKK